jgi:hypothetical protein
MQKEYKRSPLNSIFWIIIGVVLGLSSIKDGQFVPLYDGLRILVGLVAIVLGIWGFINPVVVIDDKEILIKFSIDKKKKFVLSETNIEISEENTYIVFSSGGKSVTFKLRELNKHEKERFLEDIRKLVEVKKS